MNLISCEACGVVLNKDDLWFPPICMEDGEGDGSADVAWDGDDWVSRIDCPVCGCDILETD